MAARIDENTFDEKVIQSAIPVLVDFYSDTCIPCKKMSGVVADIEDENEGKIAVYKVNVNYSEKLVEQYEVQAAPTFLAFVDGKEVGRATGMQKKEALLGLFEN